MPIITEISTTKEADDEDMDNAEDKHQKCFVDHIENASVFCDGDEDEQDDGEEGCSSGMYFSYAFSSCVMQINLWAISSWCSRWCNGLSSCFCNSLVAGLNPVEGDHGCELFGYIAPKNPPLY